MEFDDIELYCKFDDRERSMQKGRERTYNDYASISTTDAFIYLWKDFLNAFVTKGETCRNNSDDI